ncbi:MAG: PfkB family carbohydrate kinase [Nitrososphaerales archaeon]
MKIAVVSHTTIDQIQSAEINTLTIGGPTCYSGLMIKSLSHDVNIITKVGADFEYKYMLSKNGLIIANDCVSDKPTTRFRIAIHGNKRNLFLLSRCADINAEDINVDVDACLISPVINEVGIDVMMEMSKRTDFVFLDPQGLVRKVRDDGRCYVGKGTIDLSKLNIDATKVDRDEAFALTGSHSVDALYKLHVKTAIMTVNNRTLMLHYQKLYEITSEIIDAKDSTGAGDIFAGAYTATFMKSRDAEWALCYGVAAAVTALRTNRIGIEKIPSTKNVEEYASTLQNTLKVLNV